MPTLCVPAVGPYYTGTMATQYVRSPLDRVSGHRANPAYTVVVWTRKMGTLSPCGHTPTSYCGLIWYTFHIWYSLPLSCIPGTHFCHLAHILVTLLSHTLIALHTHPVNQHNKHSCHRAHLLLTPITAYIRPTSWSPWTHGTCSRYHAQMVHLPDTMHLPPILITIPPYVMVHPLAPTAHQHTTEPFTSLTIS